jgi:hypothetical protein
MRVLFKDWIDRRHRLVPIEAEYIHGGFDGAIDFRSGIVRSWLACI